ncbi:uncharacterized protein M6B38_194815 [Iris pallida]|uniref:Integrase catalytic domain-containing protein n=1 Tax=Iris pallida TaxID=29817 RepID=A0AAX6EEB1_IRIPA|nr:uncharacterized protein M6B38_194815 [Iris pallida]
MEEIIKKLDPTEVATLMKLMKMSAGESTTRTSPKLELPSIDLKLDGPTTYLSWPRRKRRTREEKTEPNEGSTGRRVPSGPKGEPRQCFNCREVGHLRYACTKPPKEDSGERHGQFGGCDRGCRGRRGGRGGCRANRLVAEGEETADGPYTEEDQALQDMLEVLGRRQRASSDGDRRSGTRETSTSFFARDNAAMYAHPSAEGTDDSLALVSMSSLRSSDWIIDSGASRHVTGNASEFFSYTHLASADNIQTANGTFQPVVGKGIVDCTGSVKLFNVLHDPSFPVSLLSISSIILQLKCTVCFDIPKVIFQEKKTGRRLGTGTWHNGLWYLDREGLDSALVSMAEKAGMRGLKKMSAEDTLRLHHRRLGHSSFGILSKLYPAIYEEVNKEKLVCDACELGKLTMSSYVSSGHRSPSVFDVVHSDVWGPYTTPINGYKYFVTFIDCFSHTTWLYLMKNKSEVPSCFRDFHKHVQTQYKAVVKVLRSDNGTEYTNKTLAEYLSAQGIRHQTTCAYTPA